MLINNKKGEHFFNEIKDKIFFEKRTITEAIKGNNQLRYPIPKHKNYDLFLKIYAEKNIEEALKQTLN